MSDPLENYVRGQPLSFRADTLNAWNEAARKTRGEKYDGGSLAALDEIFPCITVIVRNDTGADLPVRSVVYLSDWLVSPVTYPLDVSARPILKAIAPTATTVRVGILRDAIPDGEMGRAIVQGIAVVDVTYVADGLPCAAPSAGVTASLTQAKVGQAKIIQYETSGATRRALVLLIGQNQPLYRDLYGNSAYTDDIVFKNATLVDIGGGAWRHEPDAVTDFDGGTWS